MKRAAIISVILERPQQSQAAFNKIVSDYHEILRGRVGIPFKNGTIALVSLTILADLNTINSFTGRIGMLDGVIVKAAIANTEIELE